MGKVEEHQYSEAQLAAANRLRSTMRWRRHRGVVLGMHAYCLDPFKEHRMPVLAQEVHHIEPLALRIDLGFHLGNTVPLCRECHVRVDRETRAGGDIRKTLAELWRQAIGGI